MRVIGVFIWILLAINSPIHAQANGGKYSKSDTTIDMVKIPSGQYQAFLKENGKVRTVKLPSFYLDKQAVTNREFLSFIKEHPEWTRSKVSSLLADRNYLKQWKSDFEIGNPDIENSPVTNVSWYAASAYAKWVGKRLPTVDEWEYAAKANPIGHQDDDALSKIILDWYSKRAKKTIDPVRSVYKNTLGLYDMYGLVWEWNSDFNSVIIKGDSRGGGVVDSNLFCASGSLESADKKDYAAFMRFAFRASLKASYTISKLGFRCAKDLN